MFVLSGFVFGEEVTPHNVDTRLPERGDEQGS